MSFIESATALYQQQLSQAIGEGRFIRESAWETFIEKGLPTRAVENWRYTPLRILDQLENQQDVGANKNLYSDSFAQDFYTIIIRDGKLDSEHSTFSVNWLDDPLPAQINPIKHPLGVLNLALSQGGIDLHIAPNTVIDKPIAVIHITTSKSAGKHTHLNHRITVGEGAKVSLIVQYSSTSSARTFNNIMIHADVKSNAHLGYYLIQNENQESIHVQGFHAQQQSGSTLDAFILSLGAKLSRMDISTVYLGAQASASLNGIYDVENKQHVDIHLNTEHIATHCTTQQNIRGMATGSAKAVFNGRVCVHKNAVKSFSQQSNHNLLLSSTAEIDTKPELEIYNDDVKCAHGATVGQLDKDALFYLMTRGINEQNALAMLRLAFVEQQFDLIQNDKIKTYFKSFYEAKK